MEKRLNRMLNELVDINNLFDSLHQATRYCNDKHIQTHHLDTLNSYACNKLHKFLTNFQDAEIQYYQKHVLTEDLSTIRVTLSDTH